MPALCFTEPPSSAFSPRDMGLKLGRPSGEVFVKAIASIVVKLLRANRRLLVDSPAGRDMLLLHSYGDVCRTGRVFRVDSPQCALGMVVHDEPPTDTQPHGLRTGCCQNCVGVPIAFARAAAGWKATTQQSWFRRCCVRCAFVSSQPLNGLG